MRKGYTISAALGANITDAPRACWFCKAVLAVCFWNIHHCEDAAHDEGLADVRVTVSYIPPAPPATSQAKSPTGQ